MVTFRYWLYPEPKHFSIAEQKRVMEKTKDLSFDFVELAGIGFALVAATAFTRHSTLGLAFAEKILSVLVSHDSAFIILMIFAGSFYIRRARRGIKQQPDDQRNDSGNKN